MKKKEKYKKNNKKSEMQNKKL